MANGAIIDGKELFNNSSNDTGWKEVEVSDSSLLGGQCECLYRIYNGILYVTGSLMPPNDGSTAYALKLNSNWEIPINSGSKFGTIIRTTYGDQQHADVVFGSKSVTDNGYLMAISQTGNFISPVANINYAVPIAANKTLGGGQSAL